MRCAAVALALAVAALPGCGDDGDGGTATTTRTTAPPATATAPAPSVRTVPAPGGFERIEVGRGARSAVVFRPADAPARPPGVLFLHGWGAVEPDPYLPWIGHLVAAGNEVIYPRYQSSAVQVPSLSLPDALAGTRAALRAAPIARGSLVVAGHSAGGALSADYAAIARSRGLPRARAIFLAYPGRRLPGVPLGLPEVDPGRIPAGTEIVALAGARDTVVGATTARRTVRLARRVPSRLRRFVLVRHPRVADHLAPLRASAVARRTFWAPLDRLIARARAR